MFSSLVSCVSLYFILTEPCEIVLTDLFQVVCVFFLNWMYLFVLKLSFKIVMFTFFCAFAKNEVTRH